MMRVGTVNSIKYNPDFVELQGLVIYISETSQLILKLRKLVCPLSQSEASIAIVQ